MSRMSSAPPFAALPGTVTAPRTLSRVAGSSGWSASGALLATLLLPLGLYWGVQRSGVDELLGLSRLQLAGEEPWLLPAVVVSTSTVLLLPALLLATALQRYGRSTLSRRAYLALASLALFLLLLDLDLQRSVGRHITEILQVALQPHGHIAAGAGLGGWLRNLLQWGVLATAGTAVVTFVCQHLASSIQARLTPLLARTLGGAGCFCLGVLAIGPQVMRDGWRNQTLLERTYGTLLLDLRLGSAEPDDTMLTDPVLRELYPRLRESYRKAFPTFFTGRPLDPAAVALPAEPPNVILIVTESLRRDVFGPELMPRLTHWAQDGMVAAAHGPGTIYSQAAMFALLYGRSPAVYHQTLDAHVPPQLCATLRASGYECDYFTGHPKVWLRREEYLNPETMDHFVHDDRGTWPEWDQRALDNMVNTVSSAKKPVFAIVLLMSSHFEYQYPPQYEIDRPVSNSTWHVTNPATLGPEAAIPHRNRYRNSVRFIDDVVADAIAKLDPKRNLVIFTGDHGESLYDDGHYSHGYAFSEAVTKTPFAMVGPGVEPSRVERVTSHVDVLPTVLHVLTGRPQTVRHIQGVDWLASEPQRSFLETYASDWRNKIQAQLRVGDTFLRMDLEVGAPRLKLLGFEDAFGNLLPSPDISAARAEELARAFDEQLGALRR